MPIRKSRATWEGNVKQGQGTILLESYGIEIPYSFAGRFEEGVGSNPEELIGGAHSGCFSMALALLLGEAGYPPTRIETTAGVHLEKRGEGFAIAKIELETRVAVSGIDDQTFQRCAHDAKENCPVSKVLSSADITLDAQRVNE